MTQKTFTFFLLIAMLYAVPGFSQTDSTASADSARKEEKRVAKIENKRPRTAALMSAIVPGLGQIYNRQYWKVPIIYAGGIALIYELINNQTQYHTYKGWLKDTTNTDPNSPYIAVYQTQEDFYHKNRDLCAVLFLGLYGLNIIDANVAAHLKEFNIDEKLSLKFKPLFYAKYNSQFVAGLTVNLVFK